mmetsp:Transcript_18768/g.30655  ORF Transcript_18768/g.30655 Transcript_18768/m.30655 type:complete len:179 (+) Transcript_18768:1104-1640(+)
MEWFPGPGSIDCSVKCTHFYIVRKAQVFFQSEIGSLRARLRATSSPNELRIASSNLMFSRLNEAILDSKSHRRLSRFKDSCSIKFRANFTARWLELHSSLAFAICSRSACILTRKPLLTISTFFGARTELNESECRILKLGDLAREKLGDRALDTLLVLDLADIGDANGEAIVLLGTL